MDDVSAIVKASIEARILEAFRSTPEYIDELVKACLNQEVDGYGGKPEYHSRERIPYLTWTVRNALQQVARNAVQEHIKEMEPQIKNAVRERLQAADVVDAFSRKLLSSMGQSWAISVSFADSE